MRGSAAAGGHGLVDTLNELTTSQRSPTGWFSARVRVGGTYPLIAVRAERRLADRGASLDLDQADTVELARYAVELAQALVKVGENPRRLEVQASLPVARADSAAAAVEVHVLGDVPGVDEAHLDAIAKDVLIDRRARGAWRLQGDASVRAKKLPEPARGPVTRAEPTPTSTPQTVHASRLRVASPRIKAPGWLTRVPRAPVRPAAVARPRRRVVGVPRGLLVAAGVLLAVASVTVVGVRLSERTLPEIPSRVEPLATLRPTAVTTPAEQAAAAPAPAATEQAPPAPAGVVAAPVPAVTAAPTAPSAVSAATPLPSIDFAAGRASTPTWPNDPGSTAWLAPDGYHLFARQAQRFVAIGVVPDQQRDVVVAATFHKTGGPPGGGYGIIVRDQAPAARDGLNQGGRYYVLEVGDRGEIGIWRREQDQWVDLLPWTPSAAVRGDAAENQLVVKAAGDQLTLSVNGTEVATRSDATLDSGGVGVFLGGDQNQAVLTRLTVQPAD